MTSKQVIDRSRSAGSVCTNVTTHAEELNRKLVAALAPHLLPGETMPNFALVAKLAARMLAARSSELDVADAAHEAELSDDAMPRAERDDADGELREATISIRNTIDASFGDVGLRALGIHVPPPQDPRGLERYVSDFHDALLDTARTLPGRTRRGVTLDRVAMAEDLAPLRTRLKAALQVVATEAAELALTQTAKDSAVEANDRTFSGVAKTAEGLLTLAGRRDLADRVRPSKRRPGVVEAEESPPEPATPS